MSKLSDNHMYTFVWFFVTSMIVLMTFIICATTIINNYTERYYLEEQPKQAPKQPKQAPKQPKQAPKQPKPQVELPDTPKNNYLLNKREREALKRRASYSMEF